MVTAKKGYQKTQAEYQKLYGKSLATIKRWWKKGLPLDDPDAMGLHMSPKGRKAEDDFEEDSPRQPLPTELDDAIAEAEMRVREMPIGRMDGEGLEAAILRLHSFEIQTAREVRLAIIGRNPQMLRWALDAHAVVLDQMRKFEKDTPGILARNESQVPIADVEAKVGAVLLAFCQTLDALPGRAAGKIGGMDFTDRLAVLQKEVDAVKRIIEQCEYLGAPAVTELVK